MDWPDFLRRNNIEYVTAGSNASKWHVNIRCPFCADDPTHHLGISLKGYGYNCWRNIEHKGRDETKLVKALIHCSDEEAQIIVHGSRPLLADGDVEAEMRRLVGGVDDEPVHKPQALQYPKGFKSLMDGSRFSEPFVTYLKGRGFDRNQLPWLCETYDLKYTTKGRFAYRIIFPVKDRYGRLLSWTARSILPDEKKRYWALSRAESVCIVRDTLLGLPLLWKCPNPHTLLVCEGPFDAIKVTTYGRYFGVYATCLFGLSMSMPQADLLEDLRERFSSIYLLVDSTAKFQALQLADLGLDLKVLYLSDQYKDPGEMPPQAVVDLCLSLV